MGRNRQENIFTVAAKAPWYFGVILAVISYVGLKWAAPGMMAGSPILASLETMISQSAWIVATMFLFAAGVSAFREFSGKSKDFPFDTSRRNFAQNRKGGRREAAIPPIPSQVPDGIPAKPNSWSLQLLRTLEWHRFEILTADFYKVQGYTAKVTRHGADGGVDVELSLPEEQKPDILLQCKAWNIYKVGIKPIRELFGVMAGQNASNGIFLTTGEFTQEAREFAHGKPIELIDGITLLKKILMLPPEKSRALLEKATEGDFRTPTCPRCGIKMTRRAGKNGEFWGCVRYPKCRQTFPLSSVAAPV